MTEVQKALEFAERHHGTQLYGEHPYVYHLNKVKGVAIEFMQPEEIVVACVLHDVIEDTAASYNDVKSVFGLSVAEIVYAVTDELGRNRAERKRKTFPKIKGNYKAIIVKYCDRIANVREAKETDKKLFEMYVKETPEFLKQLSAKHLIVEELGLTLLDITGV